jgi:Capsule polysaccharide biosynthesis protein
MSAAKIRAATAHRLRRLGASIRRASDPARDLFDPDRARYVPSDPASVDYRNHFVDSARVFEVFLRRVPDVRSGSVGPNIAIVVMPWFATPSPWYAIALGLALARRGRPVTFVWYDLPPRRSEAVDVQNREIGRVLRRLKRRFAVVRVSAFPAAGCGRPGDAELIDDLVAQNLTWATRAAVTPTSRELHRADEMRTALTDALPRVRALMGAHEFDVVVAPGGVLLGSGLCLHAANEAGSRAATFDAGAGWTIVCTSGVAAQQTDLARAFAMFADEPGGRGEATLELARAEFEERRQGTDATSYQARATSSVTTHEPRAILVPLSVMFDTAALGRHRLFADSREWLVETVAAVLRATADLVIVRQHPSERRELERSRFDAGAILSAAFGPNPQVRFVPAEDPVNTYDLLDESRLVLPFVSTIGIEAAALGKPVVVGGAVYYADMGFVWSASTRDEYINLLARGARGELPELPNQRDLAWRCFYLNALCQRVWTDFTCQPVEYWEWVRHDPGVLFDEPDVTDILTALEKDVPVPILRHRRRLGLSTHTPADRSSRTD